MNWWAFFGFSLLLLFSGPDIEDNAKDTLFALFVCMLVGGLLGRALA